MQSEQAEQLRKEWGDKPCDHNYDLSKEYYLGADTGDYICTNCGEELSRAERDELRNKNSRK